MFAAKTESTTQPDIISVCRKHRKPELKFAYDEFTRVLGPFFKKLSEEDLAEICLCSPKTARARVQILIQEGLIEKRDVVFARDGKNCYYKLTSTHGKNYRLSSSSLNLVTPFEVKPTTTSTGEISRLIQRNFPTITDLEFLSKAETYSRRQITDLIKESKDKPKPAGWFYTALNKIEPVHMPGAGTPESTPPTNIYTSGQDAAWIMS